MSAFYHNHMFPNTYQAVRVINGPGFARNTNLLYVEWCTGEQELYNMTVDPHQVSNIMAKADLNTLNRLSHLVADLGKCRGRGCYDLERIHLEEDYSLFGRRLRSREEIRRAIRGRLPCHNPPNMSADDMVVGRKPFAVGLPVPEPFQFGFPFSDGDEVPADIMDLWRRYEHYFHS